MSDDATSGLPSPFAAALAERCQQGGPCLRRPRQGMSEGMNADQDAKELAALKEEATAILSGLDDFRRGVVLLGALALERGDERFVEALIVRIHALHGLTERGAPLAVDVELLSHLGRIADGRERRVWARLLGAAERAGDYGWLAALVELARRRTAA